MKKTNDLKEKAHKFLELGYNEDADRIFKEYLCNIEDSKEPNQIDSECEEFGIKLSKMQCYPFALYYLEKALESQLEKKQFKKQDNDLITLIHEIYVKQRELLEDTEKNEIIENMKPTDICIEEELGVLFELISERQKLNENYESAICFKRQELKEKKERTISDKSLYYIYLDLGKLYLKVGEYDDAKKYLKKARKFIDDLDNPLLKQIVVNDYLITIYEGLNNKNKAYSLRYDLNDYFNNFEAEMEEEEDDQDSSSIDKKENNSEEDKYYDKDVLIAEKKQNLLRLAYLAFELKKNKEANKYAEMIENYDDMRQQAFAIKGLVMENKEIEETNQVLYQTTFFGDPEKKSENINSFDIIVRKLNCDTNLSKAECKKIFNDCIKEVDDEIKKREDIIQKMKEKLKESENKLKTINDLKKKLKKMGEKDISKQMNKVKQLIKRLSTGIKERSVQRFNLNYKAIDEIYFDYFANESLAIFNKIKIIKDKEFKNNLAKKEYLIKKLIGAVFGESFKLNREFDKVELESIISEDSVNIENYTYTLLGIGKELSKERLHQIKKFNSDSFDANKLENAQKFLDEDYRINKRDFVIEAIARIDAITAIRIAIREGKFFNKNESGLIEALQETTYKKVLNCKDLPSMTKENDKKDLVISEVEEEPVKGSVKKSVNKIKPVKSDSESVEEEKSDEESESDIEDIEVLKEPESSDNEESDDNKKPNDNKDDSSSSENEDVEEEEDEEDKEEDDDAGSSEEDEVSSTEP